MVIFLNLDNYKKIVEKHTPKEPRLRNGLQAFFYGGLVGLFGEIFIHVLKNCFGIDEVTGSIYLCLTLIFISSLLTAIGFFDDVIMHTKCGLIIPTTGFAHSVTSSAIDYKKEGLITGIGANYFKLAGSVIVYTIIAAFFFVILRVIIYG